MLAWLVEKKGDRYLHMSSLHNLLGRKTLSKTSKLYAHPWPNNGQFYSQHTVSHGGHVHVIKELVFDNLVVIHACTSVTQQA